MLPPELERELTVIEFALPDKAALGLVLDGIIESAELSPIGDKERESALDAASGLTTVEAENAFALSVAEAKSHRTAGVVAREKAQAVKKNGLLEIVETHESLDSIGGLDVLKAWLSEAPQRLRPARPPLTACLHPRACSLSASRAQANRSPPKPPPRCSACRCSSSMPGASSPAWSASLKATCARSSRPPRRLPRRALD